MDANVNHNFTTINDDDNKSLYEVQYLPENKMNIKFLNLEPDQFVYLEEQYKFVMSKEFEELRKNNIYINLDESTKKISINSSEKKFELVLNDRHYNYFKILALHYYKARKSYLTISEIGATYRKDDDDKQVRTELVDRLNEKLKLSDTLYLIHKNPNGYYIPKSIDDNFKRNIFISINNSSTPNTIYDIVDWL